MPFTIDELIPEGPDSWIGEDITLLTYDEEHDNSTCRHGTPFKFSCHECDQEDVDIDKCLNCGKYKASHQLNADQVCSIGCVNPNEH